MPEQNIIEKIRKLLELADEERGGTEAERELAAQRAQELMLKHNIEMGELKGQSAEGDVGEEGEFIKGSMAEWQVGLLLHVGSVSFVEGYYTQLARFEWKVTLIGRADNIAFTKTLCQYLIPWLEAEAASAFKQMKEVQPDTKPRSFRRAFYAAATMRIQDRLRQDRQRVERQQAKGSTGMELARNEEAANKAYLAKKGVNLRSRQRRGFTSIAGAELGHAAGSRADLTPGRKLGR
jgi:hypothetical protein